MFHWCCSARVTSAFRAKVFDLWEEMCGRKKHSKQSPLVVSERGSSVSPDIITVTDVIATLTRSNCERNKARVDIVFQDAVKRGLILQDRLDSHFEIDLSGMSIPVARAACRFVMKRIRDDLLVDGRGIEEVVLITGVGKAQTPKKTPTPKQSSEPVTGLSLRDHIQDVLRTDFDPPMESFVPGLAQGTVHVTKDACVQWARGSAAASP